MREQRKPEDWYVLCQLASKEQDPDKLLELVQRLNRALDERLQGTTSETNLYQ